MKKPKTKIPASILAFLMLLSSILTPATPAFGGGVGSGGGTDDNDRIIVRTAIELRDAVAAAGTTPTIIYLGADIALTGPPVTAHTVSHIVIQSHANITLKSYGQGITYRIIAPANIARPIRMEENSRLVIDGISVYQLTASLPNSMLIYNRGGHLTLESGELVGGAWGVDVLASLNQTGTFIMNGGQIRNPNTSNTVGGSGVRVAQNSTFIMNGGHIHSHRSIGVTVDVGCTFIMNGGIISNNGWPHNDPSVGGVSLQTTNTTFIMNDGEITNNRGSGVLLQSNVGFYGVFEIRGGSITNNLSSGITFQGYLPIGREVLGMDWDIFYIGSEVIFAGNGWDSPTGRMTERFINYPRAASWQVHTSNWTYPFTDGLNGFDIAMRFGGNPAFTRNLPTTTINQSGNHNFGILPYGYTNLNYTPHTINITNTAPHGSDIGLRLSGDIHAFNLSGEALTGGTLRAVGAGGSRDVTIVPAPGMPIGTYRLNIGVEGSAGTFEMRFEVTEYIPAPPPVFHEVNFELNGGTRTGGGQLSQSIEHGYDAAPPATTREGYTFTGWSPAGGYLNVTQNLTITANWQRTPCGDGQHAPCGCDGGDCSNPYCLCGLLECQMPCGCNNGDCDRPNCDCYVPAATFNVTFNLNGGIRTGGGQLVQTIEQGQNATLPIIERSGFAFTGWSPIGGYDNITADITIHAIWEQLCPYCDLDGNIDDCINGNIRHFEVSFNPVGGLRTGGGELTQSVARGNPAEAPTLSREGYNFAGWDREFNNIQDDIIINAIWSAIPVVTPTFNVTFDLAGGIRTGGGQLVQVVELGQNAIAPTVQRGGFAFVGWDRLYTNIAADTTITALWEQLCPYCDLDGDIDDCINGNIRHFTVNFNTAGGVRTGGGQLIQSIQRGQNATPPIVERSGFAFAGWSPIGGYNNITADTTIIASWEQLCPYCDLDGNVEDCINGNLPPITNCPHCNGDENSANCICDDCRCEVKCPYCDLDGDVEDCINGNLPPIPTFTVIFDLNGGVRTGGGQLTQEVERGGGAIAPATVRSDYTFQGWDRDFANIQRDEVITALWEATPYTPILPATFTVEFRLAGGIRTGGGQLVQSVAGGGAAIAPAVSREGYNFAGWDRGFSNISSNIVVVAMWTAMPSEPTPPHTPIHPGPEPIPFFEITFNPMGGIVNPSVVFTNIYGRLNHLPTPARAGFDFVGWFATPMGGNQIGGHTVFNSPTTVFAMWVVTEQNVNNNNNNNQNNNQNDNSAGVVVPRPNPIIIPPRNYHFRSGPDFRQIFGSTTPTDLMPANPTNSNVRRNAQVAFNPPPSGFFSGQFPTDRNNPFAIQNPVDGARNITNSSNNTMLGTHGTHRGDFVGPMLPPTSILNNEASQNHAQAATNAPTFFADGFMGRLSIPSIGLQNVGIMHGVGYDVIDFHIGHFPTTSAWDGNIGLAAHNGGQAGYFARLHELGFGDEIALTTPNGTRTYVVAFIQQIYETDFSLLGWSHENTLTLVTCVRGQRSQRLAVVAVQV